MEATSIQMLPGERPTRSGYYVARPIVRTMEEGSQVVQVVDGDPMRVMVVGSGKVFALDDFEWIAILNSELTDP